MKKAFWQGRKIYLKKMHNMMQMKVSGDNVMWVSNVREFSFGAAPTNHASSLLPPSTISSTSLISRPRPLAVRVGSNQINWPSRRCAAVAAARGHAAAPWSHGLAVAVAAFLSALAPHYDLIIRPCWAALQRPLVWNDLPGYHQKHQTAVCFICHCAALRASAGCHKLNLGLFRTFSVELQRQYGTYFRSLLAEM